MLAIAFPTSLSIFFEESSRMEEISYFFLARAIRSIFAFIERRNMIYLRKVVEDNKGDNLFVILMGFLGYTYL